MLAAVIISGVVYSQLYVDQALLAPQAQLQPPLTSHVIR